jgi:molecular chaperone IbpA
MRTYDFSPLWRSSVGFDRLFDLINETQRLDTQDGFPPYDIVRTGEESYRISLAVAGFSPSDITITAQQNLLMVAGQKPENGPHEYIYQGISARSFERRFSLADHVEVRSATYEDGLLKIDLVRNLPESMRQRRIEIKTAAADSDKGKSSGRIKAA